MGRCPGLRPIVLVWVAAAEAASVVAVSGPRHAYAYAAMMADPVAKSQAVLAFPSKMVPSPVTSKGQTCSSSSVAYISRNKLVEVVDGLLGAMKLSSTCAIPYEHSTSDEVDANNAWLAKCPSALASFDQIIANAQGKKIALFLDYDGMLSPIVNDPEKAFMSPEMRAAVKNVAKFCPTAIVSGRSRDKVFEFVKLKELYYAGSHGMDILVSSADSQSKTKDMRAAVKNVAKFCPTAIVSGRSRDKVFEFVKPKELYYAGSQGMDILVSSSDSQSKTEDDKETKLFQPACEFLPMISEVYKSLVEATRSIKGANIENNKFCVSVHYRNVDKKVVEVRPMIDWHKGKAVEFLLRSLQLDDPTSVLPIYIRDDRTDEDAFKVLHERNCGYGILVSQVPKETEAFYSLRFPSEVMEFLNSLVRWKEQSP